jgi:hypothetical protein
MFRRMFRQLGWMTVMTFSWQHRGSVVRMVDLVLRVPTLLRTGRATDAVTEARLLVALDHRAPTDTGIRITGIHQGDVVLRGDVPPTSLDVARQALLGVSDVVEVRSDGFSQPTLDDAVAAARP